MFACADRRTGVRLKFIRPGRLIESPNTDRFRGCLCDGCAEETGSLAWGAPFEGLLYCEPIISIPSFPRHWRRWDAPLLGATSGFRPEVGHALSSCRGQASKFDAPPLFSHRCASIAHPEMVVVGDPRV